jgi:hypothetical protein
MIVWLEVYRSLIPPADQNSIRIDALKIIHAANTLCLLRSEEDVKPER